MVRGLDRVARWGLGSMFILAGSGKFSPTGSLGLQFLEWGYPAWLLIGTGLIECVAGGLLLMGRAVPTAATMLLVVMTGAIATHVRFPAMGWPALPGVAWLTLAGVLLHARRLRPGRPDGVDAPSFTNRDRVGKSE